MIAFASDRTGDPQIYITDANGVPHQLTSEGNEPLTDVDRGGPVVPDRRSLHP